MTEQEIKSYLPERLRHYPLPADFPFHYSKQDQILQAYNNAAQIERAELLLRIREEVKR